MEETFDSSLKPGSTMVGVSGTWSSNITHSGVDKLGRWSRVKMQRRKRKIIKANLVYRVSQKYAN